MRRRYLATGCVLALILVADRAPAIDPPPRSTAPPNATTLQRLQRDLPGGLAVSSREATLDTVWFGGTNGTTGLAERDGIWDFEDGTLQGWTSVDFNAHQNWFRLVTHSDFASDSISAVMNGNWSMWVGRHEPEAIVDCWPGGMGYGNGWRMTASRTFSYVGSGDVTLTFDYFQDSERAFDFTYVYAGDRIPPLNTSAGNNADGWGYSGSINDVPPNQNIGSPDSPATESLVLSESEISGATFDVRLFFVSDPLFSDQLDAFSGFLNSAYGPFGFDDFAVDQTGTSHDLATDFETGTLEGWVTSVAPGVGSFLSVAALATLDPIDQPECQCPLVDADNDYAMVAADLVGPIAHLDGQRELFISPPIYVGDPGDALLGRTVLEWASYEDTPFCDGVSYRTRAHYYPWTCPVTAQPRWTVEPAGPGGFNYSNLPECDTQLRDLTSDVPADVDSLQIVFELIVECECHLWPCHDPEDRNTSPYLDDLRLGRVGAPVAAPVFDITLFYQDVYPTVATTVCSDATANPRSHYDNNRADTDQTNAMLGDSLVAVTSPASDLHCYLNYRVHPGPAMETTAPAEWYQREYIATAGAPGAWARVRMDTSQVVNIPMHGRFATYVHESDPNFTPPEMGPGLVPGSWNKIIENNVLTPGTTVEYFLTSSFGPIESNPALVCPDTTGGAFLEFDVLPSVFEAGGEILYPTFLYVDAYNAGAQIPIETWGLRPLLGQTVDDAGRLHDNWDRYDYIDAGTNIPAPLARELFGDNGISKYQSLALYQTILYNTGSLTAEGLRDGDAALLMHWLDAQTLGRDQIRHGLWLSGDGLAAIMSRSGRPLANQLLQNFCGAALVDDDYSNFASDPSECVRLDESPGALFPGSGSGTSYASLVTPCPYGFDGNVIQTLGSGTGNLDYVDQDAGEVVTSHASIANDWFDASAGTPNFGTVMDAFSLHWMRSTPNGYTGDGACTDSAAILTRAIDVTSWFDTPTALNMESMIPCEVVDVPGEDGSAPPTHTRLLRNAPNPFNPTTRVRYDLSRADHVRVEVFDLTGRLVRTLVDARQDPAAYAVSWDGTTESGAVVTSGVYWVRLTTGGGFRATTKMVLLK